MLWFPKIRRIPTKTRITIFLGSILDILGSPLTEGNYHIGFGGTLSPGLRPVRKNTDPGGKRC